MRYQNLKEAVFLKRPNRFIAWISIEGQEVKCHVKNTGRLKELLIPGARILVEPSDDPKRKTGYSLICVFHNNQWVNIDSQVPNKLAEEWIARGGLRDSVTRWLIEVKGVTLNQGGTALFPDAPTERGKKHIEELILCREDGYEAAVIFVIQRKDVSRFSPHEERQPEFADALRAAKKAGVRVLAVDCVVNKEEIYIDNFVPVVL